MAAPLTAPQSANLPNPPILVAGYRDVVIVGLRDDRLFKIVYELSRADQIVLDLVHVPDKHRIRGTYVGVCW